MDTTTLENTGGEMMNNISTLFIRSVIFIIGFGIWLFVIPPGELQEITRIYYVCWSFLLSGILILLIAVVCGFARALELRRSQHDTA